MSRRLLVVRRRLWVRDKGLSLEPGFVSIVGERILAGAQVVIHRPDGSMLETMIRGTSTDSGANAGGLTRLWLDLTNKQDVPIGSEIWSIDG
jgi:hypothetical protein